MNESKRRVLAIFTALAMSTLSGAGPTMACRPTGTDSRYSEAQQLYLAGKFAEALHLYEQIATVAVPDSAARVGQARCLAKLGNLDSAILMLNYILEHSPSDVSASIAKTEMLADAGKNEEALIACSALADQMPDMPEKACLMRSEIFRKMGRTADARREAGRAYYHCAHLGECTKNAEQQLEHLGGGIPKPVVPNTQANNQIFAILDKLGVQDPNRTRLTLENIFGRSLNAVVQDGGFGVQSLRSGTLCPIVNFSRYEGSSKTQTLSAAINTDICSITEADLTKQFASNPEHLDSPGDHCMQEFHAVRYDCDFGTIQFKLASAGSKCATSFYIEWK